MKILYSKGNMNFKPKYRINLIIYEHGGKRFVRKYISEKRAKQHLENKIVNRQLVMKSLPDINYPRLLRKEKNYLEYEFLNVTAVDFLIEKSLINKNYFEIKKYLYILIKLVNRIKSKRVNPYTDEAFVKIFDKERKFKSKKEDCTWIAIYDLIFGNLLLDKNGKLYLIDYEWVFDFPLPKRFLFFRSIYYLAVYLQSLIITLTSKSFVCYEILKDFLIPKDWFDLFNFSQDEVKRYFYYMVNFQNEINIIQHQFDETVVLPEKKLIDYKYTQSLEEYFANALSTQLDQLEKERRAIQVLYENEKQRAKDYKIQFQQSQAHNKNLEFILNNIKSAKFYRLWQVYCKIRDKILKK